MISSSLTILRQRIDWVGLGWAYLFFCYFSVVVQLLIFFTGTTGFEGLRNSFYLSTLWLIPIFLFPRFTKIISAIIGVMLWAASLVSLCYFSIYGQEFSQSVIFIMFESNSAEASEYISQYFSIELLFGLVIYTIIAILLWLKIRPVYLSNKLFTLFMCLLVVINVIGYPLANRMIKKQEPFPVAFEKAVIRMEPAVPWQLVLGYYQYQQQLSNMQKLLDNNASLPPLKNFKDSSGDAPRTLVLVIGESTSRLHMSLYGYQRETSPNLQMLQKTDKRLTVFNDVVASRPYTIEMLQQALTFGDQLSPDKYLTEPSLINVMKQAGYKTFWITNQQTMTERNTMLTTFSQIADQQYYLNNQRNQNAHQYDSVVFEPFAEVLKDKAPKKFIVIHLLGTHMSYKYRYPEEFVKFIKKDTVIPEGLDEDEVDIYNSYDNAVLYNDYVVSSLIKQFQATDPNGFLVYFSDHGEEVYGDAKHEKLGRNENDPTEGMYTVPFMIWTSPSWQKNNPRDFRKMVDRKYSNAHFIHTWSDLAGLSYDNYLPESSLVNKKFIYETRWIGEPTKNKLKSFDELFGGKPNNANNINVVKATTNILDIAED